MPDKKRFLFLLELYVSGEISAAAHDELFEMINTHEYDELLGAHMLQDLKEPGGDHQADIPPHIAHDIIRNIFQAEKSTVSLLPVSKRKHFPYRWIAAASVAILMAVSAFLLLNRNSSKEDFVSAIPGQMIVERNLSDTTLKFLLPDGSFVVLEPESKIYYQRNFAGDHREVYLEGEGFFDVSPDPQKPFLVYYNDIVTRVLGTSFLINTNSTTGDIEVSVKTGKVRVYKNLKNTEGVVDEAVIVTPNQKAIYKKETMDFQTTIVDNPQVIKSREDYVEEPKPEFIFQQESLKSIFSLIEKSYAIEVITENDAINNCLFTGDVSGNDLFTTLNIICLTVNASYEINGTKILIKGKGCN